MMDGVFNVLKPPGMTSHDVVAVLRRVLRTKKVGHGGTLDPDAAGVLPVFAGSATRLIEYIVEGKKSYIAEFLLGMSSDTGDDSGHIVARHQHSKVDEAELRRVLTGFIGKQLQIPPMYSAVKVGGRKLYQMARKGLEIERNPRSIEIYRLELLNFTSNSFTVCIECSKGTYIRVLGEDIASRLGTFAVMSFLLRTSVGPFWIEKANTIQEIAACPSKCMQDVALAVDHMPKLRVNEKQAFRITQGVRTTVQGTTPGKYALLGPGDCFLGIVCCKDSLVYAEKIIQHYHVT